MNRIAIPNELKRKLLIESGHRCAIQTCKHPEVEFHHIIPWGKCQEHSFDNMIVLCPNCHSRADRGKIDRKSLLLYKANLQSILSPELKINSIDMDWESKNYSESNKEKPIYEIDLWYPYFNVLKHSNLIEVNTNIQGRLLDEVFNMRTCLIEDYSFEESLNTTMSGVITSSYEITCFTQHLLSIRFSYYSYSAGAAHPQHFTKTYNFLITPTIKLTIQDLFTSLKSLEQISILVRKDLINQREKMGFSVDKGSLEWINGGTKPEPVYFQNFNLTRNSIVFTFDEYQVGPYAEGSFQVELEMTKLKKYINSIVGKKYFA